MTDRINQALAAGATARHASGPQPEPVLLGRRRLTTSPTGFLAGFAARCCLDAAFAEQYLARAQLLGYEVLPPEQVERARQAAVTAQNSRGGK